MTHLSFRKYSPLILSFVACLFSFPFLSACADNTGIGLAGDTVLIIRHAEKPDSGRGLSDAGQQRADAYVKYFHPFTAGGGSVNIDWLIAASDSKGSERSRLTLEPLSHATGMPIHQDFSDKQVVELAESLRTTRHGKNLLIAVHHDRMPDLVAALGGKPDQVLPDGWPKETFNWVIELVYDNSGQVTKERLIVENF
jgi:hypothetical protein